ncbi:MAG: hypothetical protein CVU84_15125 [Firmicutes bacterium HGW-Firmicutes-1]|nr:MAG: hypothetical protein CVU84_15125 [Firmicutes bacterium HGW-Firmicutes-1]
MQHQTSNMFHAELYENLRVDCKKCFGFCCVVLYFSASDGFPTNKDAGKPCINLQHDFTCAIHKNLWKNGLKGCTGYDCFGAGQKVAQVTYGGYDWRQVSESAKQMFEVFLIMRQLHEMIWYLSEALTLQATQVIHVDLSYMADQIKGLTYLSAESLIALNIAMHRDKVNPLLLRTSELVRTKAENQKTTLLKHQKPIVRRMDFIGKDLRKTNLRGADLRGTLLIAANLSGADLSYADFIGADLRDADLRGANLADSIFLTQAQMNTAKGDSNTKLPMTLVRPAYWDK